MAKKSKDQRMNNWVKNTKQDKPYVTAAGQVMWGTSASDGKKEKK